VESWRSTCAAASRLIAVGMCASTPDNDASIRDATTAIRTISSVPIVLGGTGIIDERHALALGASTFSDSFASAVDQLDLQPRAASIRSPRSAS
jgi:hypothetical protein